MTEEATAEKLRVDKFGGVPYTLEIGDIWSNDKYGCFVVASTQPAVWHGEDRDVYAGIDQWFTIRSATPDECLLWGTALAACAARRALRVELDADASCTFRAKSGTYNADNSTLDPPEMRRLDSYDDRWEPPKPVALTSEQCAIEAAAISALAALKGHELTTN